MKKLKNTKTSFFIAETAITGTEREIDYVC